jgi:hypothetical protein
MTYREEYYKYIYVCVHKWSEKRSGLSSNQNQTIILAEIGWTCPKSSTRAPQWHKKGVMYHTCLDCIVRQKEANCAEVFVVLVYVVNDDHDDKTKQKNTENLCFVIKQKSDIESSKLLLH